MRYTNNIFVYLKKDRTKKGYKEWIKIWLLWIDIKVFFFFLFARFLDLDWTGPGGWTVKTENRIEIRFFKHRESGICGNFVNP